MCEGGREHVGRTARTLTTPIFGGRRAAELEISVLLGEGGEKRGKRERSLVMVYHKICRCIIPFGSFRFLG